jgi:hypothetical protein
MIPERDINILKNLSLDSQAKPTFDLLKYCLTWPDERPSEPLSAEGREFLSDLWTVRGFIHRSVPEAKWGLDPKYFREIWEFGVAHVETWPGFKRLTLSENDEHFLSGCMKSSLSDL